MRRDPYDPFEVTTRVQAVRDFADWYFGNDERKRRSLEAYWADVAATAISAGISARMDSPAPGKLVVFPGVIRE